MLTRKVRKAVIPAAGFGTRFLPFTKSVPKELVPLVDKPVIQYVVEEAAAAGIDQILIITSNGKGAIQDHFNRTFELEHRLAESRKDALLEELRSISSIADIHYVSQQELNGLGDAVRCAKSFVGNEPFAILLGDTVLDSTTETTVTGQLVEAFEQLNAPVTALEAVPMERVSRYGVVDGEFFEDNLCKVNGWVEKPTPEEAPSNFAIASRYLFTPDIFEALEITPRGKGNEIQLTDAMRLLLSRRPMYGRVIAGKRYDLGSKLGFLTGTVEFGLRRPEFREAFAAFLKEVVKDL